MRWRPGAARRCSRSCRAGRTWRPPALVLARLTGRRGIRRHRYRRLWRRRRRCCGGWCRRRGTRRCCGWRRRGCSMRRRRGRRRRARRRRCCRRRRRYGFRRGRRGGRCGMRGRGRGRRRMRRSRGRRGMRRRQRRRRGMRRRRALWLSLWRLLRLSVGTEFTGRLRPAPLRSARFARATACLRDASPSKPWWRAARDEGLS